MIQNLDMPIEVEDEEKEEEETKDSKMKVLSKMIEEENLTLDALDGFLLVLSGDGDVTYVSDNIGDVLGLAKVRYVHKAGIGRF